MIETVGIYVGTFILQEDWNYWGPWRHSHPPRGLELDWEFVKALSILHEDWNCWGPWRYPWCPGSARFFHYLYFELLEFPALCFTSSWSSLGWSEGIFSQAAVTYFHAEITSITFLMDSENDCMLGIAFEFRVNDYVAFVRWINRLGVDC